MPKIKRGTIISIVLMLFHCTSLFPQGANSYNNLATLMPPGKKIDRELAVGDKIPHYISIETLVNYPMGLSKDELKGKFVILDFFATWCGPCVSALPKLQTLQSEFANQLKIIIVTDEPERKLREFFGKNKIGKSIITLPTICSDTILSEHFKHKTIPHEIWIDQKGVIKAITTDQYVTEANIREFLSGRGINFPVKYEVIDYDQNQPVFVPNEMGNMDKTSVYSGFTSFINGPSIGSGFQVDSSKMMLRYNEYNNSILGLYALAFDKYPDFKELKRCILQVADTSKYIYNGHKEYRDVWNTSNLYSYEARIPLNYSSEKIKERLRSDLDYFFNLTSSKQKKTIPCIILKSSANAILNEFISEDLPNKGLIKTSKGNFEYFQSNQPLYYLINTLNNDSWLTGLPFAIDETDFQHPINIKLDLGKAPFDINSWNKALKSYGLEMIIENREIDMLSIIENK